MGQVFRATHLQLMRAAAFKVLHPQYAGDPTFQARFVQEARTAAALIHPNIIEIYDFGQHDGLVLPDHGAVDRWLAALAAATAGRGGHCCRCRSASIWCARPPMAWPTRTHSMVHRDIKPDNLLLNADTSGYRRSAIASRSPTSGWRGWLKAACRRCRARRWARRPTCRRSSARRIQLDGRSDIYSLASCSTRSRPASCRSRRRALSDAVYKHVYTAPPSPRQQSARPLAGAGSDHPALPEEGAGTSATRARRNSRGPSERGAVDAGSVGSRDVRLSAGSSPLSASPPEASTVRLAFERERQTLTPGEATDGTHGDFGSGDGPRQMELDLQDVPANWLPLVRPPSRCLPAWANRLVAGHGSPFARCSGRGLFDHGRVPRHPATDQAGERAAVWVVAPFHDIRLDVTPARVSGWSHGRFRVNVTNSGNDRATVALGGHAVDPALTLGLDRRCSSWIPAKPGMPS